MGKSATLIAVIYVLDQITKWAVVLNLPLHDVRPVVPGFLNLVHVTNTGVAFGMFQNNNLFFIFLSAGVLFAIVMMAWKGLLADRFTRAAITLLVAGVLGNLTDRLVHGHVIDFVDVHFRGSHWPAFNVADSAICIAAGLLILSSFRDVRPDHQKPTGSSD